MSRGLWFVIPSAPISVTELRKNSRIEQETHPRADASCGEMLATARQPKVFSIVYGTTKARGLHPSGRYAKVRCVYADHHSVARISMNRLSACCCR